MKPDITKISKKWTKIVDNFYGGELYHDVELRVDDKEYYAIDQERTIETFKELRKFVIDEIEKAYNEGLEDADEETEEE